MAYMEKTRNLRLTFQLPVMPKPGNPRSRGMLCTVALLFKSAFSILKAADLK
jgi:hypothetical protein